MKLFSMILNRIFYTIFMGDSNGIQIMIDVSAADGNPYTSLPGDNNRSMMSSSFTIGIDSKGGFA